jgi:hypothetical protein
MPCDVLLATGRGCRALRQAGLGRIIKVGEVYDGTFEDPEIRELKLTLKQMHGPAISRSLLSMPVSTSSVAAWPWTRGAAGLHM